MRLSGPAIVLAFSLAACATQGPTVQEGRLQKRTHQSGWHVDLHRTAKSEPRTHLKVLRSRETMPLLAQVNPPMQRSRGSARNLIPTAVERDVKHAFRPRTTMMPSRRETPSTRLDRTADAQNDPLPRKKWNTLAIPAFLLALGTIALGLFTTGTTAVIIAAAATITISGISLARIRKREQAGKGFALIGLILGLLAALITAISIAIVGFI